MNGSVGAVSGRAAWVLVAVVAVVGAAMVHYLHECAAELDEIEDTLTAAIRGDHYDARYSQGYVNKGSGQTQQTYGGDGGGGG